MGRNKDAASESTQQSPPSLEQWGGEKDQARFAENAQIARSARAARKELAEKNEELLGIKKRLGLYEQLQADKGPPPVWVAPPRPESHHAIPCLLVTDIHWDENVRPAEVEGYNCYNRPIAEMRVQKAFTSAVKIVRNYFAGVKYDGFQLFLGGDLMSGIIHEELLETNQGTLCESIITVVEPLEAGINLLAKEFGKVNITAVVGNHGRRTRKPRSKFRAMDNFDWLVYKLIERSMRGRKDVTIDVSESADAPVNVYGTRYRLTHGDQFRGGSGISAELSPLLIGSHRKAKRQSAIGNPYDVLVMGHWHQTLNLPSKGIIMGGSVVGYNEYAYLNNFAPEPPQCSMWLTTPERGITMSSPVFVQDRKAEGW
jgi:predicted phosphodiesterase